MKDIKATFIIKTRVYVYESGQVQDFISKEEFKSYPTDEEIFLELTRCSTMSAKPIYSQVEKIFKLTK